MTNADAMTPGRVTVLLRDKFVMAINGSTRRGAVLTRLLLISGLAASGACRHGEPAVESTRDVPAEPSGPQQLPNVIRPGLKSAMGRHGEQASALTRAVALGSHEETVEHATDLLEEPKPARPIPGEKGGLNDELPPKLFAMNEAFRAALENLRSAANASDDELVITQVARVLQTCRDCHRAFAPAKHD